MPLNRRRFLMSAAAGATLPLAAPSLSIAQQREMRLGILTPPGHPWNRAALAFAENLKTETNGRLSVAVFPSGQLGNEGAMMQQLQTGALDMGWIMAAEIGSRVPAIAAVTAPFVVRETPQLARLVRHPRVTQLFDLLPRETGTIGLAWGITGMRVIFSARDISSLADLRGMKIRTIPAPAFRDFYTALGAAPTPIPTPQVFDAMSNGQVDGLESDLEFSWNQRFDRVSRVILTINAQFMPVLALVSGRVWQSLPGADRELIAAGVRRVLNAQIDELVANEPRLIEQFRAVIPMRPINTADAEAAAREFDRTWLERAPVLRELREIGRTI